MFSKIALIFTSTLALSALASPTPSEVASCNTGSQQCCNQVYQSSSSEYKQILSQYNLDADGIIGQIGSQCSPITVIGASSGARCTSNPVCCSNNSFNGVIAVGCNSITL